jgi:hypothetical protein
MVNPFDRTFFRFILGFTFILSLSFSVLYFADRYKAGLPVFPDFSGVFQTAFSSVK